MNYTEAYKHLRAHKMDPQEIRDALDAAYEYGGTQTLRTPSVTVGTETIKVKYTEGVGFKAWVVPEEIHGLDRSGGGQ